MSEGAYVVRVALSALPLVSTVALGYIGWRRERNLVLLGTLTLISYVGARVLLPHPYSFTDDPFYAVSSSLLLAALLPLSIRFLAAPKGAASKIPAFVRPFIFLQSFLGLAAAITWTIAGLRSTSVTLTVCVFVLITYEIWVRVRLRNAQRRGASPRRPIIHDRSASAIAAVAATWSFFAILVAARSASSRIISGAFAIVLLALTLWVVRKVWSRPSGAGE